MCRHRETAILVAWAVLATVLITAPVAMLLQQSILIDDTFYALSAARHLASGEGSTVDGAHRTNGYQPLWVWILSILTAAGGLSPDGTVRAGLILCAVITLICGVRLGRLVRLMGGSRSASFMAIVLWLANPYFLRRQLNGLETVLAAWLLIETVQACLASELRSGESAGGEHGSRLYGPPMAAELRAGFLAGLAALARIDLIVVALGLALRRRWAAAAAALLVPAPWIAWCWLQFGHPVPLSGAATRTLFGILHDLPDQSLLLWESSNVSMTLASLSGLAWPARALQRAGLPGALTWIVVPAALAALSGVLVPGRGARERIAAGWGAGRPLVFWIVGLALYDAVAYGLLFPAPWHLNRYLLPLHALAVAWVALFYDKTVVAAGGDKSATRRWIERNRGRSWWFLWAVAAVAATVPYWIDTTGGQPPSLQLEVARWVREDVPSSWKVGMVQSGVVGYYAGRPVINLDGKVNPSAFRALRDRRMGAYLDEEGIDLFGDWNDLVERCVFGRARPFMRQSVRRLEAGVEAPPPPFAFYRTADE